MKSVAIVFIVSIAALVASNEDAHDRENMVKWIQFKNDQDKDYHHSEEPVRMVMFLQVDKKIQEHNKGHHSYKMAHNHLSDKTDEEMRTILGTYAPDDEETRRHDNEELDPSIVELMDRGVPAKLDYRTSKCLGPVKNQGSCGSCWTFSAIAPLEYSYCMKHGNNKYVSLSEQQIVDCDQNDSGCNGGWPSRAWAYLQSAGGSETAESYPYTGKDGTCQFRESLEFAKVSTYASVPAKNVTAMQAALVTYGPLSVAIYVTRNLQNYHTGVFSDSTCPTNGAVNHGVTVVGYDAKSWIIRNSWGAGWGNKGYIQIKKGVNMCSVESYASYVVAA